MKADIFLPAFFALSLIVAKSGIKPIYQKTRETEKYVVIAKTSHKRGLAKFTHNDPYVFGNGNTQIRPIQSLPMCNNGNIAAQITAKIVIASADLLIAILHLCLNNKSIAEINVPACPIPTHQTKLVISHAHITVLFKPHIPIPSQRVL